MNEVVWKLGDTVDDRFELVELCGKGNYGEVWKAHDKRLQTFVALKRIYPFLTAEIALKEAQKQSRIMSDYIARPKDVPLGKDYIIMEYYPSSLAEEIKKRIKEARGPFPYEDARRIFRCCLQAVSDAHNAGVIHGDIKPANILLDGRMKPYLSDFGVARAIEEKGVPTGLASSTWAAPEVLKGELPTERSDFFSLGITIYLLLTNQHPFYSNEPSRLFTEADNIKNEQFSVQPLKEMRQDTEDWVNNVIMGFLSRDPKVRSNAFDDAEVGFMEPGEVVVPEAVPEAAQEIYRAYAEARTRVRLKRKPEAVDGLTAVIDRFRGKKIPELAKLCSYKAFLLIGLRKNDDAEKAATKGIENDPVHLDSLSLRARARYYKGKDHLFLKEKEPAEKLLLQAKEDAQHALQLAWPGSQRYLDIEHLLEDIDSAISEAGKGS
jgi:hypothetical protein